MAQNKGDSLGDRMKQYEHNDDTVLMRRTPVLIRLDGKAFHTYTKPLTTPYDEALHEVMMKTSLYLCKNIQNAVAVYTQSDEISILLNDWYDINVQNWYGNRKTKIETVSASMVTAVFNRYAQDLLPPALHNKNALFDSRAYNIPHDDVTNYFIWRQQDATRNSIQMIGHHYFTQSEMHGLNNNQVKDKLLNDRGILWQNYDTWKKRGACVILDQDTNKHIIDEEPPIFQEDRNYLEKLL